MLTDREKFIYVPPETGASTETDGGVPSSTRQQVPVGERIGWRQHHLMDSRDIRSATKPRDDGVHAAEPYLTDNTATEERPGDALMDEGLADLQFASGNERRHPRAGTSATWRPIDL